MIIIMPCLLVSYIAIDRFTQSFWYTTLIFRPKRVVAGPRKDYNDIVHTPVLTYRYTYGSARYCQLYAHVCVSRGDDLVGPSIFVQPDVSEIG